MKKIPSCIHLLFSLTLISFLFSCQDANRDDEDDIRKLEVNAKILDVNGNIKTFPLTIIISDKLNGNSFPQELQDLCGLSKLQCKTLPIAGILRLGPNNYYTYNCISELKIPDSAKPNETVVTQIVEKQVTTYLNESRLKDYDSLLTSNHEDWDIQKLALTYINNTTDSIFFFSQAENTPAVMQIGNNQYSVYNNITELRRRIDELACTGQGTISVFYYPPPLATSAPTTIPDDFPSRGVNAGDTCIGQSKYQKLHNGNGGFMAGKLIEANSTDCDYVFPTGPAGDTCVSGSKYLKFHDGKGGFRVSSLVERNSKDCGYTFPTGLAGDTCVSGSKFQKLHNGKGGFMIGNLMERSSRDCGFAFPTGRAGDTCVSGSKFQRMHNGRGGFSVGKLIDRNSKDCGYLFPTRGLPAAGFTCYNGAKYEKLHDGSGGFIRGKLLEADSDQCKVASRDNTCANKSDPLCEQDSGGNYTGRRVQYCYNKSGEIIKTIVVAKCDSDCRCIN